MKVIAVIDAEIEAKRFLNAVKNMRLAFGGDIVDGTFSFSASKYASRLKRASMDLTRSLAVMRSGK